MDPEVKKQVFLGGACGGSPWRHAIAAPALEAAGVSYFNPQLAIGAWTPACEAAERLAKAAADVLLFVINGETRGVASIGEAAYYLGLGRPLALVVTDIGTGAAIDGDTPGARERDDLNRGRIFVRSMARAHCVPVFADVESAVAYAIRLVREQSPLLDAEELRAVLAEVRFRDGRFEVEEIEGGFLIRLCCPEQDVLSGARELFRGRQWFIGRGSTRARVVRTAFLAAAAWQEHEARESFTYRSARLFSPHTDVDALVRLASRPPKQDG